LDTGDDVFIDASNDVSEIISTDGSLIKGILPVIASNLVIVLASGGFSVAWSSSVRYLEYKTDL